MKFNWFIGIDVSKRTLDIHLRYLSDHVEYQKIDNTAAGIKAFLSRCKELKVDFTDALFCLEYTGIYNELLVNTLSKKRLHIWVEQGLHVKKSLGMQRGKNDKVDASRLSEYAFRFQDKCKLWEPVSSSLKQLKDLTALRNRLIKAKKLLSVPITELAENAINKQHISQISTLNRPVITQLCEQIKQVEKEISTVITNDQRLQELQQIITSVDGIGPVTAWEMIIATNQFKSITDGRKFACYAGVAPFEYQSGTSIKGKPRVSHLANKKMKQLLHLSALSATVMKGELNEYYNRKVAEGKSKMLVLNNIRNKMILRIFACVNENRKYEKTYMPSLA
ncbi:MULTISPECIES: IS110 family transposase [unclassified Imperialibacter]|uniref:IS110 family transposase n=1 Tax=unclassified Imperialibacter TaxID=2629706 RepID=UPI0012516C6A|nr:MULTISPECIES: IS110 family transposase [unclassified Imperialibacter]CAD5254255.1 transposase [Imperialibacter sp. 75]CAD5262696.1 transposase [Imperialibacter sp. 89]VVT35296.1 transposase [Imperialibacter sp. EC-SDR9]